MLLSRRLQALLPTSIRMAAYWFLSFAFVVFFLEIGYLVALGFPVLRAVYVVGNVMSGTSPLALREYVSQTEPDTNLRELAMMLTIIRGIGWLVVPSAFIIVLTNYFEGIERRRQERVTRLIDSVTETLGAENPGTEEIVNDIRTIFSDPRG